MDSQQSRLLVILNPIAGNVQIERLHGLLQERRHLANVTYDLYETTDHDRLAEVIDEAAAQGCTLVVAAGGDGTVSLVANELVGRKLSLGILPVGAGNLLAQELNIPLHLEQACQLLTRPLQTTQLDVMQVGQRYFVSHVSLGVYSRIIERTAVVDKRRYGKVAYLWQMAKEVMGGQSWDFSLTTDGEKHHLRVPPWQLVRYRVRQHVGVTAHEPLPLRADGEIIGHSAVSLNVRPQAIRVVVPAI